MNTNKLLALTLAEAQEKIAAKQLSPVALTAAYVNRITETEKESNSFMSVDLDGALKQAHALEEMQMAGHFIGPLHGIPVAIKDNIDLEGFPTTASSKVYANNYPVKDAPVAARLKSAGAVIVGKTIMHEFAWGATTDTVAYGAAHNPWDPKRFCCGSSGGSAASIANGTSLAALGTDTGGSVRLPSSVCGVVGMRPTYGRVSLKGIVPLAYSMDACGPITRTVRDNAIMLNVMAGHQSGDITSKNASVKDFTRQLSLGVKNIRIGILPDVLFENDQPDVIEAVKNAMEIYRELGAEIVECKMENLSLMQKAWYAVCSVEASTYHQNNIRKRPDDYSEEVRALLQAGELIPGTAYVQAQRYRSWLREQFRTLFQTVDLLLFPTLPATAVPIGEYDLIINGKELNMLPLTCTYVCYAPMTGVPALQIPCGLDHDGMPIGFQLLGREFEEEICYRAGAAFEKIYNLHDQLPAVRI